MKFILFSFLYFISLLSFSQSKDSLLVQNYLRHVESMDDSAFQKYIQNTKETIFNYSEIDKMPQFPGGIQELYSAIDKNFHVDKVDSKMEGRVFIQFQVHKSGHITNIEVIHGLNPEIHLAISKAMLNLPKWEPGQHNGETVTVKYLLPLIVSI